MAEGVIKEPTEVALHPKHVDMDDPGDGPGNLVMQDHSYSKSPYTDVLPPIQHSPVRDKPQQLLSLIKDPEQLQALAAARQVDQKYFENIGKTSAFEETGPSVETVNQSQISRRPDGEKMDLDGFTEVSLMLQSAQFQLPKDLQSELDDGEHTDPYAHEELPQAPSPVTHKRKRKMSFKLRQSEEGEELLVKKKMKKKKKLKLDGKKLSKEEKRAAKLERKKLKRKKKLMKSKAKRSLGVKEVLPSLEVMDEFSDTELKDQISVEDSPDNVKATRKSAVSNGLTEDVDGLGLRRRSATYKGSEPNDSDSAEERTPASRARKSRRPKSRVSKTPASKTRTSTGRPLARKTATLKQRSGTRGKALSNSLESRSTPTVKRKSVHVEPKDTEASVDRSKSAPLKKEEAIRKRVSNRPAGRVTRNSLSASDADLQRALKASAVEARQNHSSTTRSLRSSAAPQSTRSSPKNSRVQLKANPGSNRRTTRSIDKASNTATPRRKVRR